MSSENVEKLQQQDEAAAKAGRDRSTIGFPYLDLDDAIEVAKAIHNNAGTACTTDQLAGYLNQSARGGGFRIRVLNAKTYGLIENPRGTVALTDIGKRMADPAQEAAARVQAFFHVPLFSAVYDKFKGNVLPPKAALTREISGIGVAASQAERARQLLEKSAEQSGFFAHGRDRLVEPVVRGAKAEPPQKEEQKNSNGGGGGGGELDLDPLLVALIQKIPSRGAEWPAEKRVRWFRTFAMNVSQVYDDDDTPVELKIDLAKEQAS